MNAPTSRAELVAKRRATVGPVHGSDLRAHLKRDAVVVVATTHSLVDCAVAVATDDADAVRAWLTSGVLRRPDDVERAAWPDDPSRRWNALVVQPFVLVQDVGSADGAS